MNILAVGAHPDDVEFMCAGTLARLAGNGHMISLLSLTAGECGSADLDYESIARIRLREAQESAAVLNAKFWHGGVPDKHISYDTQIRYRVCEIFRAVRPDIVFAPSPQDYVLDHDFTSMLARDAATAAPTRNFVTGVPDPFPPTEKVPYLYYCEPLGRIDIFGNPVQSTTYVDISSVIQVKEQMLGCHASQREWMRQRHGTDEFTQAMRSYAAAAGESAGFQYAEGFRQHLAMPFPNDNLLVELLGAGYVKLSSLAQ